ncbi:hypothetical protein PG999_012237 [Apiospora kogelbergensis]|uniref:Uncharacterized protein n=1 Tax=Apiospora kogelbergensis TaxID=1337665 RepID=A0AAW0QU23_9PEZI
MANPLGCSTTARTASEAPTELLSPDQVPALKLANPSDSSDDAGAAAPAPHVPQSPASRQLDEERSVRFRPDSPNTILFLYSDSDGDDSSSSNSSEAPPQHTPDAHTAPSPFVQPYRFKKDTLYYIDKRLNDPARLERHIRDWFKVMPQPRLTITGTHKEMDYYAAVYYGGLSYQPEYYTVLDFKIYIDMTPYLSLPGTHDNP